MIQNDWQRENTQSWISKFKSSIEYIKENSDEYPEWMNKAQIESLQSEIDRLISEVKEYNNEQK